MNSEQKMRNLFIQHLRVTHDGEQMLADTFSSIGKATGSQQMEAFCRKRAEENENILRKLSRISTLMSVDLSGEKDSIIRSMISEDGAGAIASFRIAKTIVGRALNSYQAGAYWTAISCALELGETEVALLLMECLEEKKFDRADLIFLKELELELSRKKAFNQSVAA